VDFPDHDEHSGAMNPVIVQAMGIIRSARFTRMERLKRLERCQSFKTFNPFKDEHGVALVVVLWIFIFLFVLAVEFSSSAREEGMAAHRYAEEVEGYYLALAGFEAGLYQLLESAPAGRQARRTARSALLFREVVDGSWREEKLGQGYYRVRLVDEAGKINLNRVDEETLRRALANLGVGEPRREIVVDSILDWRDQDDFHRTNGAESDYYRSLSPPYTAKNGPFDSVAELLWVRGMTPELFVGREGEVGLEKIFSVDSRTERVNLRTAPAEVIHALLGIPLEKSRAIAEERTRLSEQTIADILNLLGLAAGDVALRQFVFTGPTVVAIEAVGGRANSSVERRVRGVVRIVGGGRVVELSRWIDRDVIGKRQ
jgi:general secretion pathway protein K